MQSQKDHLPEFPIAAFFGAFRDRRSDINGPGKVFFARSGMSWSKSDKEP
jgi:hypothetical protein